MLRNIAAHEKYARAILCLGKARVARLRHEGNGAATEEGTNTGKSALLEQLQPLKNWILQRFTKLLSGFLWKQADLLTFDLAKDVGARACGNWA